MDKDSLRIWAKEYYQNSEEYTNSMSNKWSQKWLNTFDDYVTNDESVNITEEFCNKRYKVIGPSRERP